MVRRIKKLQTRTSTSSGFGFLKSFVVRKSIPRIEAKKPEAVKFPKTLDRVKAPPS